MLNLKVWSWDKAVEGTQVYLVKPDNIQSPTRGVVGEIKRSNRCRMVDGKPIKSTRVVSVIIECNDGKRIEVIRANPQYQIILKQ